jgi:hypothetical protein
VKQFLTKPRPFYITGKVLSESTMLLSILSPADSNLCVS